MLEAKSLTDGAVSMIFRRANSHHQTYGKGMIFRYRSSVRIIRSQYHFIMAKCESGVTSSSARRKHRIAIEQRRYRRALLIQLYSNRYFTQVAFRDEWWQGNIWYAYPLKALSYFRRHLFYQSSSRQLVRNLLRPAPARHFMPKISLKISAEIAFKLIKSIHSAATSIAIDVLQPTCTLVKYYAVRAFAALHEISFYYRAFISARSKWMPSIWWHKMGAVVPPRYDACSDMTIDAAKAKRNELYRISSSRPIF